jgi:hypothetical protein
MYEKWKTESNEYTFYHLGYKCVAYRQKILKHWLGFVVVPIGHPWYSIDKAEFVMPVHGGITITDHCPFDSDPRIDEWWIGFECNQPFDLVPKEWELDGDTSPSFFKDHIYRDLEYVIKEMKKLAKLAKQVSETESY